MSGKHESTNMFSTL